LIGLLVYTLPPSVYGSSLRRDAIVRAVEQARPSVVNINGHKTVHDDQQNGEADGKRVNGMGTGVVIDERGYIITNCHVVEGVRQINVSLADGKTYIAKLVAHDPYTDLAIIHIPVDKKLPLIKIGTSSDLMQAERVVAIGNAFGYPHTVTCGFISSLNRSVQVNDSQKYYDLIQTDASINPGNSGGPLLNIDGEMIGINVAVRVGAQGIGFAIPVDTAIEVAAELMSAAKLKGLWHGVVGETVSDRAGRTFVVKSVGKGSPAAASGIKPEDVIREIGGKPVRNRLDLERALIGADVGDAVSVTLQRDQQPVKLTLVMAAAPRPTVSDRYWSTLGVKFASVSSVQLVRMGARYNGGLRVTDVRRDSPAARQGIRKGDVLVGMHKWETISLDNINYVLSRPDLQRSGRVKFYVVRGGETLYGHLPLLRR
jgi:serine protease Do